MTEWMFGRMAVTDNRYICDVIECSKGLQILICYYFDEWGVVRFCQTQIWRATLSGCPLLLIAEFPWTWGVAYWLRRCATTRTVPGSIPGGVTGFFPSDRTRVLGSTQPLVKMSTRNIPGGEGGRCVRLTTSPPSCAEFHGNLGA